MSRTAAVNSRRDVRAGSYSTVARAVAKLTAADPTPSAFDKRRSMRRAQAAHVIPVSGTSTRRLPSPARVEEAAEAASAEPSAEVTAACVCAFLMTWTIVNPVADYRVNRRARKKFRPRAGRAERLPRSSDF